MDFSTLPLTLRQLQYAVAVAEYRSFRRASEACFVSQPSLSAQVAELESSLGVRLFERERGGVLLTPAGEAIVARARQTLLAAQELAQEARRFVDPLAGTLRVGIIPTVAPYLLSQVVEGLQQDFPRLTLLWTEEKTAALVEALGQGRLDAVVLALEAPIGELEHEVLFFDPFWVALPRGHRLAKAKSPLPLDRLDDERMLLLDDGHCFREQALSVCATSEVEEADFRATSLPTLVQMVRAGVGLTLLPELALAQEAERGGLAVRPLPPPAPGRTIVLAWRKGSPLAPALQQIATSLRAHREAAGP